MKLTLIGTGAMYTAYNSACSLIDNKIIIDMPNGTVKQMLKLGIKLQDIDTILVTHMHGDHTADIPFFIKYIFNYLKSTKEIKIIGPVGIKKKIIQLFNAYNFENEEEFNREFNIEIIEVLKNKVSIDNYIIKSYEVVHGEEKPALGYVINDKIGFTGDSGLCEGIEKIFKNSKLVVSDSSLINGDDCHLGFDNLQYLVRKYKNKIFCTHLRDKTREEIINSNIENIEVNNDFFEIEV